MVITNTNHSELSEKRFQSGCIARFSKSLVGLLGVLACGLLLFCCCLLAGCCWRVACLLLMFPRVYSITLVLTPTNLFSCCCLYDYNYYDTTDGRRPGWRCRGIRQVGLVPRPLRLCT
jgi:hypothetical protein